LTGDTKEKNPITRIIKAISDVNEEFNGKDLNTLLSFQLKDNPYPPKFLSIYNSKLKQEKKYQLYMHDGEKYVRIPVLGEFGLSEYSLYEDLYKSLVNQDF